jgi:protoporphyrinogen oxidase
MESSYQNGNAIVLGGGISGLTAARALQEEGRSFVLLERCPTLGGLTRTVEVGEFCVDYTGSLAPSGSLRRARRYSICRLEE